MIDGRNATTRRIRLQVVRDRTWMLCKYVAIKRPPDGQVFVLAAHPYHSAPSSHKHYIRHNTLNVASARPLGQRYWEMTFVTGPPFIWETVEPFAFTFVGGTQTPDTVQLYFVPTYAPPA